MSNTSTTIRNDLKKLAKNIENLAREVQTKVDQGSDLIVESNELVRNSSTFTFTLGELYALEQVGTSKKVKASTVSNPNNTSRKYHNVRDSLGRFTRV